MPIPDLHTVLTTKPQVVDPQAGPEPCLSDIILRYYMTFVHEDQARKFRDDYIATLRETVFSA